MENYKFVYNNKKYELGEENYCCIINDEEHPVTGIEKSEVIELLHRQGAVDFDIEYYDEPCQSCLSGVEEKNKYFKFLEYHFFIYTKKGKYIISSISEEYKGMTYNILLKKGIIDNSYIISVLVCSECGDFSLQIEQCEV